MRRLIPSLVTPPICVVNILTKQLYKKQSSNSRKRKRFVLKSNLIMGKKLDLHFLFEEKIQIKGS
jgi:hypothetical protein